MQVRTRNNCYISNVLEIVYPPPLDNASDFQYDIKYLELSSIKQSDFAKIIAYIGK